MRHYVIISMARFSGEYSDAENVENVNVYPKTYLTRKEALSDVVSELNDATVYEGDGMDLVDKGDIVYDENNDMLFKIIQIEVSI